MVALWKNLENSHAPQESPTSASEGDSGHPARREGRDVMAMGVRYRTRLRCIAGDRSALSAHSPSQPPFLGCRRYRPCTHSLIPEVRPGAAFLRAAGSVLCSLLAAAHQSPGLHALVCRHPIHSLVGATVDAVSRAQRLDPAGIPVPDLPERKRYFDDATRIVDLGEFCSTLHGTGATTEFAWPGSSTRLRHVLVCGQTDV